MMCCFVHHQPLHSDWFLCLCVVSKASRESPISGEGNQVQPHVWERGHHRLQPLLPPLSGSSCVQQCWGLHWLQQRGDTTHLWEQWTDQGGVCVCVWAASHGLILFMFFVPHYLYYPAAVILSCCAMVLIKSLFCNHDIVWQNQSECMLMTTAVLCDQVYWHLK